jgi:hypothetical protein
MSDWWFDVFGYFQRRNAHGYSNVFYCVALKAKRWYTTHSDALKPRIIVGVLASTRSFCDGKGIRVRKVRGCIHEANQYIGIR